MVPRLPGLLPRRGLVSGHVPDEYKGSHGLTQGKLWGIMKACVDCTKGEMDSKLEGPARTLPAQHNGIARGSRSAAAVGLAMLLVVLCCCCWSGVTAGGLAVNE